MTGSELGLVAATFLACLVEAVEALTIVLAVGTERNLRSALWGTAAALACLAVIVGALGPSVSSVPLGPLRIIVGGLLLIFGLGWLRKAILRAAGRKGLHDEAAIFARESELARTAATAPPGTAIDGYAFAVAFKGVLLEGLEVAFIVVTFGANQHNIGLAAIAAGAAVLVVAGLGFAVRSPLERVPENTLKFCVGVMLCAFGIFWSTEGVGGHWPGGDAALLALVIFIGVIALGFTSMLKPSRTAVEAR